MDQGNRELKLVRAQALGLFMLALLFMLLTG